MKYCLSVVAILYIFLYFTDLVNVLQVIFAGLGHVIGISLLNSLPIAVMFRNEKSRLTLLVSTFSIHVSYA